MTCVSEIFKGRETSVARVHESAIDFSFAKVPRRDGYDFQPAESRNAYEISPTPSGDYAARYEGQLPVDKTRYKVTAEFRSRAVLYIFPTLLPPARARLSYVLRRLRTRPTRSEILIRHTGVRAIFVFLFKTGKHRSRTASARLGRAGVIGKHVRFLFFTAYDTGRCALSFTRPQFGRRFSVGDDVDLPTKGITAGRRSIRPDTFKVHSGFPAFIVRPGSASP